MAVEATPERWRRYDRRERLSRFFALLGTLIVVVLAWNALEMRYTYLWDAHDQLYDMFGRMTPPDVASSPELVGPLIESVHIAVLGTGFGVLMSIPVAYIAAENTARNRLVNGFGKFVIVAARSVDVIIWVLVLVVLFGPGPLVSIIALSFRSIGFIGKLLAEAIEEIDPAQVRAVAGTGAGRIQAVAYGIVPQIKPAFISIVTYRWDSNVRSATIVGLVGGGGIGEALQASMSVYAWREVSMVLLIILGVVLFSEWISSFFREKIR